MLEKKLERREFLRSALTVGAGSVLGAGLATACQTTPTAPAAPVTEEVVAPTEAPAVEAPTEAPTMAPAVAEEKRDINVCGVFPLSGFLAADGEEMRNGVVMAIDEINEMGGLVGHKLNYIEIDDVDSIGDQVTTAFVRAIEVEKSDVIFSGYHLTTGPELDICANAGALYYNNNTQKAWTDLYASDPEKYWPIFQTDPNDEWYGAGFARYLDKIIAEGNYVPPSKTFAILHGDDVYDSMIAENFMNQMLEYGWENTVNEAFTADQVPDWGPMLSKVRDYPDTGILFTTTYSPADNAAMIKNWVADPLPCVLYQQYGPCVPEYLDLAGEAANGVIWATVLGFLPDEIGNTWADQYFDKFGVKTGWANAPGGWDQVWVWAKAVALAGDPFDYKKVAKMTEMGIHRGVTGSQSYVNHGSQCYPWQTPDSSLGQAHIIVQIQDMEHKVVFPQPYTTGEYQDPPWFG